MNLLEGYRIMFCFLDTYYWENKSDELGDLLGSMSLLPGNIPADSANKEDWEVAVSETLDQMGYEVLSSDTVYFAMIVFLRNWASLGTDGTIIALCVNLEKGSPKGDEWLDAVKTVMDGNDDPYLHLTKATK
jgi:hypothetical protein